MQEFRIDNHTVSFSPVTESKIEKRRSAPMQCLIYTCGVFPQIENLIATTKVDHTAILATKN